MEYDRIQPWEHIVTSVSREYNRKFDMCDAKDIKQSLYEWFLVHPNKLANWEALSPREMKNLIYRSLRNQALDYCQAWKAKTLGYEKDDLFYYTPEMVEALLPQILREEEIERFPIINLGRTGGTSAPAESGNMNTMIADVSSNYEKLSQSDKKAVFMRFALSFGFAEIARQMELPSEDAARMRVKRAIGHLVVLSGGYKVKADHYDDDELLTGTVPEEVPEGYHEL